MHHRRDTVRAPLLALLAFLPSAPTAGQAATDVLVQEMVPLHAKLNAAVQEIQFGGAVVIERAGTVLLQAGYGLADRDRGIPFTSRTIAQVGSLTKQFTAMAVLDLWRRDRLRLNDPVSRHLPETSGPLADRTIHQLLTHTAGLPDACGPDFRRTTLDDLLRCLESEGAVGPAGSVSYSNVGYSILAAVVQAVSATRLEDYLRERFFIPLRMDRTGYHYPTTPDTAFALGYGPGGARRPISERIALMDDGWWNLKGNGGMQASAEDMHRWSMALRHGPVIVDTMRAMAFSPHETRDPGVHAGYGWFVRTDEDGTYRVSHTGSDGVFYAAALWYPRSDTFVYFVGNSGEQGSLTVLRRLLAELGG